MPEVKRDRVARFEVEFDGYRPELATTLANASAPSLGRVREATIARMPVIVAVSLPCPCARSRSRVMCGSAPPPARAARSSVTQSVLAASVLSVLGRRGMPTTTNPSSSCVTEKVSGANGRGGWTVVGGGVLTGVSNLTPSASATTSTTASITLRAAVAVASRAVHLTPRHRCPSNHRIDGGQLSAWPPAQQRAFEVCVKTG
jgi:hypothetical protein